MYFLDVKYYDYSMCDVVMCSKIENPYDINLAEYIEIGKKESPGNKGYLVPDYETLQLGGRIKIEIDYFADNKCSNKKTFSKIIEKPAIDPRCSQKVKGIGNCRGDFMGYEFNTDLGKCLPEKVAGCNIEAPFNSLEECQKVCE